MSQIFLRFLSLFAGIQLFHQVESTDYGKSCKENNSVETLSSEFEASCNFQEGICIEKQCQCRIPNMMIYSERLDACGAPTGSYCDTNITCLPGNICSDANICICPETMKALADGSCSAARYERCSTDDDCNVNDFLACYEGLCDCKSSRRTIYQSEAWDDELEDFVDAGCKIRAGETCFANMQTSRLDDDTPRLQPCAIHAECNMHNEIIPASKTSLNNTEMSLGQCSCLPGFTPTPEGTCRKDHGSSCTTQLEECNSNAGLMCKNNSCVCIDDDTYYDREQRACVSYAGESCGAFPLWYESYEIGCTQNAECVLGGREVLRSSSSTGSRVGRMGKMRSCQCKVGFQESMDKEGRTCVPISGTLTLK